MSDSTDSQPGSELAGDFAPSSSSSGTPTRSRGRRVYAAIGAIVLIGGGVGGYVAASGGSTQPAGGSATPGQAVQALFSSVDHSDLIGALDVLDPGERAAWAPGVNGLAQQLKRLGILSSSDLNHVNGVHLSYANVHERAHVVVPGVDAVGLSGGDGSSFHVDYAQLPIGGLLRSLGVDVSGSKSSTTAHPFSTGDEIATIEQSGRWYVSLGWTIALAATKGQAPPPGGIVATGATSPSGAVELLFKDVAGFDLHGLIADLPPGEAGALQAYAPRYEPNAQAKLDTLTKRYRVALSFPGLATTTSALAGGNELVRVTSGFVVAATVNKYAAKLSYEKRCVSFALSGSVLLHDCAGHPPTGILTKDPAVAKALAKLPSKIWTSSTSAASSGIVTVDEGGRWYVSPTATALESIDQSLGTLNEGRLKELINEFKKLASSSSALARQTI